MVGNFVCFGVKIYDVNRNTNDKTGDDLIEWYTADVKVGSNNAQTVVIDKKFAAFKPVPSKLYDLDVNVSEVTKNGYKQTKFKIVGISENGKAVLDK